MNRTVKWNIDGVFPTRPDQRAIHIIKTSNDNKNYSDSDISNAPPVYMPATYSPYYPEADHTHPAVREVLEALAAPFCGWEAALLLLVETGRLVGFY